MDSIFRIKLLNFPLPLYKISNLGFKILYMSVKYWTPLWVSIPIKEGIQNIMTVKHWTRPLPTVFSFWVQNIMDTKYWKCPTLISIPICHTLNPTLFSIPFGKGLQSIMASKYWTPSDYPFLMSRRSEIFIAQKYYNIPSDFQSNCREGSK